MSAIFQPMLKEGSGYYIKNFKVINASPQHRSVDHPKKILITKNTLFTEVTICESEIPMNKFNIADIKLIRQRCDNEVNLTGKF